MTETIDCQTLYASFANAADSPYNDEMFTVTGTITYIGPDSYGLDCIIFGDPNIQKAFVAFITPNDAGLEVGEEATISGHCEGYTQDMVILKHCHIEA